MPKTLPPEIHVTFTPRGELIDMHARHVGCLHIAAVPVIVLGLVFAGSGLAMSLVSSGLYHRMATGSGHVDVAQVLFGIPFFLGGLVPVTFGCFMFGGRNTIELRDDLLIATHRSGPLRWRRKVPVKDVRKFQIKAGNPENTPAGTDPMLGALNVLLDGGARRNLAWGYHKDTLRSLADYLAERCQNRAGATLLQSYQPAIEIEERTVGEDRFSDAIKKARGEFVHDASGAAAGIPPQPADTHVTLNYHDAGLTFTVPPVGVRTGAKGMFGFMIIWNGFMVVFTAGAIASGAMTDPDAWVFWVVLPVFWCIGIWMAVAAINAGRRMAILDVAGDTLLITRRNLFKTHQQEVRRDNIQSIRRDNTGTKVNDVPILNLQVRLKQGKKIAMLSQLSNEELAWIAAVLREALDAPG